MKLSIALIIIFLSLILAYMRSRELKKDKETEMILLELAKRIKSSLRTDMLPIYALFGQVINENSDQNRIFSTNEEVNEYIKHELSSAPLTSEYLKILARLPYLPSDELNVYIENLIKVAEKGVKECEDIYLKEGKIAFLLYPGVAAVLILVLI